MSVELNTGADWEQSKRLVIHWHNRWAVAEKENARLVAELEELKLKLTIAVDGMEKQIDEHEWTISRLRSYMLVDEIILDAARKATLLGKEVLEKLKGE